VRNSWRAKLSDFGSANLIRLATTPAEGAVTYAAPEVRTEARNQQTPKVDAYSFGVLLCEITLCQFPPDPSEFATFLASVRDNADPRLYELAQNCTKRDPEQRPLMRDILTQIGELIPIE
jgi:serine/threonine protein kinase